MIFGPEKTLVFLDGVHIRLLLWWSSFNLHLWQISGSVPESISDVQERIRSVFTAVLPEDLKISIIQFRPSSLSFEHRDSSWFSESVDDIMGCSWWIFKVFAIYVEEHFFWNCSTIFSSSLSQIVELLSIFTSKRLCLWNVPLPSEVRDLLPINPVRCQMFLHLFLIWTSYFSSHVFLPSKSK